MKHDRFILATIALLYPIAIGAPIALTQPIVPANDGTNTAVTPQENQFNITGGQTSRNGDNLFHSFQQFNLSKNQIANFISSPHIHNILGRVTGGSPSIVNGLIQISGGSSNLFLMNPAGIVFGPNASLNIPADFTATTATSIGFEGGQFHGVGTNRYSSLVGEPQFFEFNTVVPGSIINQGDLTTQLGHDLTLLGGTLINTGSLNAPQGNLILATVPGENRLRISQPGHLLSLELPLNLSRDLPFNPVSLPQLLAGGGHLGHASEVTVNDFGEVVLSGSGLQVKDGDILVSHPDSMQPSISSHRATLSAANYLSFRGSQLETTGNLSLFAGDTIQVRDSDTAFWVQTGGDLILKGDRAIDIVALNRTFDDTALQARGNITLISPEISLDAHLSAENVSILNSTGESGNFFSLYDPIFTANGDVNFGNYTGRSLKIEAGGQIVGGNITITGPDTTLSNSTDPDAAILRSSAALILRSGVSSLATPANLPPDVFEETTQFVGSTQPSGNDISVAAISTAGGPAILDSAGEIFADRIFTQGGDITLNAIADIQLGGPLNSSGGNIDITTGNFLRLLGSFTNENGVNASISSVGNNLDGTITIRHQGSVNTPFIVGDATTNGTAGAIASNSEVISPQFEVPVPPSVYNQGNITIITPASTDLPPNDLNNNDPILPTESFPDRDDVTDGNPPLTPPGMGIETDGNPPLTPPGMGTGTDGAVDGNPPLTPPGMGIGTDGTADGAADGNPPLTPPGMGIGTDGAAYVVTNDAAYVVTNDAADIVTNDAADIVTNDAADNSSVTDEEVSLERQILFNQNFQRKIPEPLNNPGFLANERLLSFDLSVLPLGFATEELGAIGNTFPIENSQVVSAIADFSQGNDASLANSGAGLEFAATFSPVSAAFAPINSQSSNATTGVFVAAIGDRTAATVTSTVATNSRDSSSSEESSNFSYNEYFNQKINDIFAQSDLLGTVWQIEQLRNQEIEDLLGITASLDQQQVAIASFQNTLKSLEAETGKKAAIIYVIARTEQLELVLLTGEGSPIRASVPEANRADLFLVVQEFKNEITNPKKRRQKTYLPSAQQLHEWILSPLEENLTSLGIETLMFSMGQGMRSLPIAALHDGQQFLIEKYSISLIPSFSLTNTEYRSIKNARVLAMGISEFTEFPDLPGVPLELATVISQLGTGKSLLNEDFTFENLRKEREETPYQILHLATHADFKTGSPSNSFVQLWDRKLTLDKMPQMGWENPPVELLVLSACRTAVGDRNAELGFAGLAVLSGAKSALASLWYISDRGTLALMSEFYQQLAIAPVKAEALQQAQIAMISGQVRVDGDRLQLLNFDKEILLPPELANLKAPNLDHPYFWSSFIIIGSPW